MFDLPVDSPEARRDYTKFRKILLAEGFTMLQYSIYARYCESEEAGAAHRRRIRKSLPPEGNVRLMSVTDRQFGKMEVFSGISRSRPESAPEQMRFL